MVLILDLPTQLAENWSVDVYYNVEKTDHGQGRPPVLHSYCGFNTLKKGFCYFSYLIPEVEGPMGNIF